MAKKSDASKRVLKDYENVSGSMEILDPNQPVYLLNQQEMDEELKHFRSFYAQNKPHTSTPTTEEGASTILETTSSTSVTKTQFSSFSSQTSQSSVVQKRYDREESASSSITKRVESQESQKTKTTFQKTVGTSLKSEGTAIDSSLEELEQRPDEDGNDSSSKPTAVVIVA